MDNSLQISDERTLQRELKQIAVLGGFVMLCGFGVLQWLNNWPSACQWLLQTSLLWAVVISIAWRKLRLNRASDKAALYPRLGWGNRLTLLRGALIAGCGGFLFADTHLTNTIWLPAGLYSIAASLDRIDGYVARRTQQVSLLGNELDINFDALGLVIAPVLAWNLGKIHPAYLLLSAAYYLYRWALRQRTKRGLAIYPIPANPLRRSLAGFQMGFIALSLWPLLSSNLTVIASIAFMLPVLFGFAVDWGVLCGWLKPQLLSQLANASTDFFQPSLRLVLLLLAAKQLAIDPLYLLSVLMMVFGFAGRQGAALLLLAIGWQTTLTFNTISNTGLIFTASWLLLLGTGRYSIWRWGDDWVSRYDGA
jgi:CDP-diacylglycerol--glycerol-3-phosphate 3-phosphatidyltransferase